jgi:cyclic-di-GMP-binding protein
MSLSINLVPLDLDSINSAETRASHVIEFTKNLGHLDTFLAASRLLEQLKTLNRQKFDAETRINTLELYRKITLELSADLEDVYSSATVPLNEEARNYALIAEALWLETGYGYKRALVDLKQQLINFKGNKLDGLVILRALEALKNEAQVNYLTYTLPSASLWSDLHKIYYHALQLSLEAVEIEEHALAVHKTINSMYSHTLLMYLASPQRLDKANIRKMSHFLARLAKHAQLRGIGFIENPAGVFLVELDSNKPPVAYLKSRSVPNVETDILLVTIEVARNIHQQLKYIQANKDIVSNPLPTDVLEVVDEDLLKHLIKFFGAQPTRAFSRIEKSNTAQLAIGLNEANILFRSQKRPRDNAYSTWEIMNISPAGYALKTINSNNFSIEIGEIIGIKEHGHPDWSLGCVVWLITKSDHVEVGVKLLAPTAQSVELSFKRVSQSLSEQVLLVPKIDAVQQQASVIAPRGFISPHCQAEYKSGKNKINIEIKELMERTASFERYEYCLINDDLS